MNLKEKKYDVVVIGGGPGGYVAAIRASQLGLKVVLVEKEHLGGICLNWGCIPTKALLRTGEIKHYIDKSEDYGFSIDNYKINFEQIIKRSRNVSEKLTSGVQHLLKKNNVEVIFGIGKLLSSKPDNKIVEVNTSDNNNINLQSSYVILATGAKSKDLPFVSSDGINIWDYKSAMLPKKMPESIVIVGSGAIGIEFASFYNDLGCEVTIVEVQKNILPNEDDDISEFMLKSLTNRGIKILTNSKLLEVKGNKTVKCKILTKNNNIEIETEKLLLAVGIEPNIKNLGLEKFNIKIINGYIKTNEWSETTEKGIFAIGDITSGPWLAHKASHEGVVCVEQIKGLQTHKIEINEIPACTYSRPQVASIGLTEKKAIEMGKNIKIGNFPFMANGKAVSINETEGFVKTIFDKDTGELLGAHLIGPEVTELIQGFAIAKKLEATEEELISTIFPHPTLSESMHESVLDAFNKVLHY